MKNEKHTLSTEQIKLLNTQTTTRSMIIVLRAGLRACERYDNRFSYLPMLINTVVAKTELDSPTVAGAASELLDKRTDFPFNLSVD